MAIGIIGQITGITVGPETGTVIEEMIVIKGMPIGIKIVVDPGIEMEAIETAPGRVPNPGVVLKTGMKTETRVETTIEIETDLSPNGTSVRNSNNAEDSLLSMTNNGHVFELNYADGKDFDMALNM